ncbi:MAG: amino acid transporter substrate-binding protein, family [Proteobacteria bacterium]|nr:amino acid transporter substrate-binding protein, family [Pseudomonadota bacterium]
MLRGLVFSLMCFVLLAGGLPGSVRAGEAALRVVVLENSPPMSYRDETGQLTGFSVEIARALCQEIRASCVFDVTTQGALLDSVARGKADIAAAAVFETAEHRGKLLFAKPYYRSLSLWLARPDVPPGRNGVRVAVVHGSVQEDYARRQGWDIHQVRANGDLAGALLGGEAQAALVPMISALQLQKSDPFRRLGLAPTVLRAPELSGDASFGISLRRPGLREEINAALDRIKRNGTYDRINSRFLPFRVS